MFESVGRGFQLLKESLKVVSMDKEILLFPVISSVITALLLISFIVPMYFILPQEGQFLIYFGLFIYYFVSYFIVIFFNAGLVTCANIRMNGGDPKFSDGINNAMKHFWNILMWALIAATVGMILRIIAGATERSRSGVVRILGGIITSLLGAAWSIATFFVVPIIVLEDETPLQAVKKSVGLVTKTWGENVIGQISMGIFFFVLGLLGIIPITLGLLSGNFIFFITMLAVALVYWFVLGIVSTTLNSVFAVALYNYAKTGKVPEQFSKNLLEDAFASRKSGIF